FDLRRVSTALPPWTSPNADSAYGKQLFQALGGHPGVKEAFNLILQVPQGQVRPIYFFLETPDAELVCWETLCDATGQFLTRARDPAGPIGRTAHAVVSTTPPPAHKFSPPLRLMAVISALGPTDREKAWDREEWDHLYKVVQNERQEGLPIRLRVVVGQEELFEHIQGLGDADVELLAVPASTSELQA